MLCRIIVLIIIFIVALGHIAKVIQELIKECQRTVHNWLDGSEGLKAGKQFITIKYHLSGKRRRRTRKVK